MKKRSLLAGIVVLGMLGGCVLAVNARDSKSDARAATRREAVRLLEEKLGYLRDMEGTLAKSVAEAKSLHAQSVLSSRELGALEIQLLEARARRVDVQLELATWRTPKSKSKSKSGSKSQEGSK
jgi:hypothetical protein